MSFSIILPSISSIFAGEYEDHTEFTFPTPLPLPPLPAARAPLADITNETPRRQNKRKEPYTPDAPVKRRVRDYPSESPATPLTNNSPTPPPRVVRSLNENDFLSLAGIAKMSCPEYAAGNLPCFYNDTHDRMAWSALNKINALSITPARALETIVGEDCVEVLLRYATTNTYHRSLLTLVLYWAAKSICEDKEIICKRVNDLPVEAAKLARSRKAVYKAKKSFRDGKTRVTRGQAGRFLPVFPAEKSLEKLHLFHLKHCMDALDAVEGMENRVILGDFRD
jgi:hypothetical protein